MSAGSPTADATLVLRYIRDRDEFDRAADFIGQQLHSPGFDRSDRRATEVAARFDEDRRLLLVVVDAEATIVGAVFGWRGIHGRSMGVRAIGVAESARGLGVGRALMEAVELEALETGAAFIHLGAADDARGFYEALGYRGKRTGKEKQLPPRGRVRDLRTARLRAAIGDLEVGLRLPAPSTVSTRD